MDEKILQYCNQLYHLTGVLENALKEEDSIIINSEMMRIIYDHQVTDLIAEANEIINLVEPELKTLYEKTREKVIMALVKIDERVYKEPIKIIH